MKESSYTACVVQMPEKVFKDIFLIFFLLISSVKVELEVFDKVTFLYLSSAIFMETIRL